MSLFLFVSFGFAVFLVVFLSEDDDVDVSFVKS